jgi:hypothetical protein
MDRAVDSVHGSMVDRGKGVSPDLILTVGRRSIGWGGPRAAGGGARPESRRSSLENELPTTICNVV